MSDEEHIRKYKVVTDPDVDAAVGAEPISLFNPDGTAFTGGGGAGAEVLQFSLDFYLTETPIPGGTLNPTKVMLDPGPLEDMSPAAAEAFNTGAIAVSDGGLVLEPGLWNINFSKDISSYANGDTPSSLKVRYVVQDDIFRQESWFTPFGSPRAQFDVLVNVTENSDPLELRFAIEKAGSFMHYSIDSNFTKIR